MKKISSMVLILVFLFGCSSTSINTVIAQTERSINMTEDSLKKSDIGISESRADIDKLKQEPRSEFNNTIISGFERSTHTLRSLKEIGLTNLSNMESNLEELKKNDLTNDQNQKIENLMKRITIVKQRYKLKKN